MRLRPAAVVEEIMAATREPAARQTLTKRPDHRLAELRAVRDRAHPAGAQPPCPAAAASACASSLGITRPKVRSPVAWTSSGNWSPAPRNGCTRSMAELAGETWSIRASLVIGSEARVAPESKSPR